MNCKNKDKDLVKINLDEKVPSVLAYYCKICGHIWADLGIDSEDTPNTQATKK